MGKNKRSTSFLDTARRMALYFIAYAFVGWMYELFVWIFEEHSLMNRGFLFGPWLPIYGFGGLILYLTVCPSAKKPMNVSIFGKEFNVRPAVVFILITVCAAAVELVSTYIMDALGVDWTALWQYGDYRLNFDRRIALLPAIKFGILGCIIIYLCQDRINRFVGEDAKRIRIFQYILIILFAVDVVFHIRTGSHYTDIPVLYF